MAIFVLVWTSYDFGQWYCQCFEGGTGSRHRVIWYGNGSLKWHVLTRAKSVQIGLPRLKSVRIGLAYQFWISLGMANLP